MTKPHSIIMLTSGQAMVFNDQGDQIPELQQVFKQGEINRDSLREIASQSEEFALYQWKSGIGLSLSKEEFFKIFGL